MRDFIAATISGVWVFCQVGRAVKRSHDSASHTQLIADPNHKQILHPRASEDV